MRYIYNEKCCMKFLMADGRLLHCNTILLSTESKLIIFGESFILILMTQQL